MTQKVKAFVTGRFPFYHDEDEKFIGTSPTEVTMNSWLQAQVDAGLIELVGDNDNTDDSASEPEAEQSSGNRQRGARQGQQTATDSNK